MVQSSALPQSSEDERILEHAAELFQQLGIRRSPPDTVTWEDRQDPGLIIVRYGEIKLARSIKGTVSADDWKLLLAAPIIYGYLLLRDPSRHQFTHMILPLSQPNFRSSSLCWKYSDFLPPPIHVYS